MAKVKNLYFLRHGQAFHNVRAEPMRAAGCTFQEFLDQMKEDDSLDSALTEEGIVQAKEASDSPMSSQIAEKLELLVSSPLSRCIDTADLIFPRRDPPTRIILEEVREINGLLLNGKRRKRSMLEKLYPHWDFSGVSNDDDVDWTADELESDESVRARGLKALDLLWRRNETEIAIVAHGGFFRKLFSSSSVVVKDDVARFSNCECKAMKFVRKDGVYSIEQVS
ncbi:hypothetical protein TrCOL_g4431 [Triparma columacea]|uniref:Phosphoglycerate mutase n=1 Tax=Triparma columacea TaxID=722753 RepID=A0A9W7G832_9STRA|nr:hypothetical protein TrCOL_g4431 [Triparma columacea]